MSIKIDNEIVKILRIEPLDDIGMTYYGGSFRKKERIYFILFDMEGEPSILWIISIEAKLQNRKKLFALVKKNKLENEEWIKNIHKENTNKVFARVLSFIAFGESVISTKGMGEFNKAFHIVYHDNDELIENNILNQDEVEMSIKIMQEYKDKHDKLRKTITRKINW